MPNLARLVTLPTIEQPLFTVAQTKSPAATDQPMISAEVNKVLGTTLNPLLNSLPLGSADKTVVIDGSHNAYVGEGFPPVPAKVAAKIRQGKFFEMGELLSRVLVHPKGDDSGTKPCGGRRRSCLVMDIFTYGTAREQVYSTHW